jgi:hypothetical protein
MNQHDVDDLIREWADIGEEQLPDRYLQAALTEIEKTPQSGAWLAPLKGFIMRFQPIAPYLAVATAVVAAVVLYVAFAGPPVGNQDASPTPSPASPQSSAAVSPSPTDSPLVSSGTFEITTPLGSEPSRTWYQFDVSDDPRGVSDPLLTKGLRGYTLSKPNTEVNIYLDPKADYVGSVDTTQQNLVVAFSFTRVGQTAIGFFESTSGECRITFDEFTPTVAAGSLNCTDVPMTFSDADPPVDGVAQLSGTFTFDPSAKPGHYW